MELTLQLITWAEQCRKEALAWARGVHGIERGLSDYEAGMRQGWDDAISTLKLHGLIKE